MSVAQRGTTVVLCLYR